MSGDALDEAGCLVDFAEVNDWFERAVAPWRGQKLNDVPPFDDDVSSPSAEHVARVLFDTIAGAVPKTATLVQVEVEEEPGCRAAYRGSRGGR